MASTDVKDKSLEKIYKFHDELRFRKFKWAYSKYYDYPDGQDLLGKLSYTTKMALLPSAIMGHIYSKNFKPGATTLKGKLFRMARIMVPGIGMAAAYTCVTYYATNIRKKDDAWNHVLGGLATGAVAGFAGSTSIGLYVALIFASLGAAQKIITLRGEPLIDVRKRHLSSYYQRNYDFSMAEERPGNWTMNPPK